MVTNLVSNAIKYGEGKPILVSVQNRKGRPFIAVKDHGRGIPEDEHAKIFERYERIEQRREAPGLGLFISRAIVEAHGGKISVDSHPGEGSTFTAELA